MGKHMERRCSGLIEMKYHSI